MIRLRQIRYTDGPIHDVLHALWDTIAEYAARDIIFVPFNNPGMKLSHADCLARIHQEEMEMDSFAYIFAEHDFLPELARDWTFARKRMESRHTFFGCMYGNRGKDISGQLMQYPDRAGGWFFLLRKQGCPIQLPWHAGYDPANEVPRFLEDKGLSFFLDFGTEDYPNRLSIHYPFGVHLFFSRHYNDDPAGPIIPGIGARPSLIQDRTRADIVQWFLRQPRKFQTLFVSRFPSGASPWFFESIDSLDTSLVSSLKSAS